jgi:hypothetical protein
VRRLPVVLGLLACLLLPANAAAWGSTGHRVVARIAENHLAPETARAIAELIGPQSLVRVATWADEIRSDPAWAEAAPWHYINIPADGSVDTMERNPRGDVLEAMQRFAAVLEDRDAAPGDRATALKFLVHLVADVHQPLHTELPDSRGEGTDLVLWFGEPTDLHSLWDTGLIEHQKLSFSEMAELIDLPAPGRVTAWQADGFRDWIAESQALLDTVYDVGDRRLGWTYAYRTRPILERRLLQAGVRLAGLLDSLLTGASSPPEG